MPQKRKASISNFRANINILLRGKNITQAQFAKEIHTPKTTVNKWVLSNSAPSLAAIENIAKTYDIPIELLNGDPDDLGNFLNISQPEIDEAIKLPSIFLRNVRVPKRDPLLARVVGVYDLYMPSALYENRILQRSMKIFEDANERYYYEAINLAEQIGDKIAPEARFAGSIVVGGEQRAENIILIGGQTSSMVGVQFLFFRLPQTTRFKSMSGFILGDVDGVPFTNPVCAKPVPDAEPDADIREYAQGSVYVDDGEFFRKNPDVLRVFHGLVQNSWFPERVRDFFAQEPD